MLSAESRPRINRLPVDQGGGQDQGIDLAVAGAAFGGLRPGDEDLTAHTGTIAAGELPADFTDIIMDRQL